MVIVFEEANVDVPPDSPNRIPRLEPVELTSMFSLNNVPAAACANCIELEPVLVNVKVPLKVSAVEFPVVNLPEPVFASVVAALKVFPPAPVLSLEPFLVIVVVLLNVDPLRKT